MDFMADQLVGGHRFRLLTLVDNHSRESLAIEVGQRLTGDDVVRVLEQVTAHRGKPCAIRVDNGPEFVSRSLDLWAYFNGVKLDFSRPGKPTDNAVIESFNGRLRDECLNQHWFLSLDEARVVTEAWREDYNRVRPHGALGNRTPSEFARPVDGHAHLPALHGEHPGWYQVGGSVINVLVAGFFGLATGFNLNSILPKLDVVFGPDTPSRRILACLYLAIAAVSAVALVVAPLRMGILVVLLPLQILYKTLTVFLLRTGGILFRGGIWLSVPSMRHRFG
jgi:putative transposase